MKPRYLLISILIIIHFSCVDDKIEETKIAIINQDLEHLKELDSSIYKIIKKDLSKEEDSIFSIYRGKRQNVDNESLHLLMEKQSEERLKNELKELEEASKLLER
ncbi:hypothetical protein MY04_4369 [Flammeovirga sp. MY04]|uniref:hypothetical protein n=1 Tax=Flammeovirga sp. MY04 TaxID=1191459 RepID=UPI0008062B08|nr:hypothetical protein [Flammeovirga sp. MY04]ANQ51707.1 hypothetical protein MY04_4369 [Flammeovirga sp. MY04]